MTKLDKRLKYHSVDDRPVTISLRLPRELHARLEQYATQHRQSISELLRDGLEWRLSEGDPRGVGTASTQDDETYYMSNTTHALADMRQALARQEAQIQAIGQALERQATLLSNGAHEGVSYPVIHGNTAREPEKQKRPAEQEPARATASMDTRPKDTPTVLQAAQNPALARVEGPTFDTTRYYLGARCPKGHDYQGTGQSLRRKHNKSCRDCENEGKTARRLAKRQAVSA